MRAINASIMRQMNRKMILDQIRRQPISRVELAKITKLTRASVTQIIEELIEEGLVAEASIVERLRLGRRSTQLAIQPDAGTIFGVNLNKTQCSVGAVNLRGELLAQNVEMVAGRSPDEVLTTVTETIHRQRCALNQEHTRVLGLGFCAPGALDFRCGRILRAPGLERWDGVPIVDELSRRTGLAVQMENAANALALEELYFGVSARAENFALVQVDETICAGLVVHGNLYHGAGRHAVQLGHISLDVAGEPCACGNRGCLEQYLSIPALLSGSPYHSWSELMENQAQDDARKTIERVTERLTYLTVNLINAFDIERVVLAGELTLRSESLVRQINENLAGRTAFDLDGPAMVCAAGSNPARVGAMPAYDALFRVEL